ncbi:hypothetical protein EG329_010354 [Mollisiaceae sp. DMI_Dod_QoI]|nr:hypothetical protein EG329_010354 [Helotiales sp. DMI_Dod_QoI]
MNCSNPTQQTAWDEEKCRNFIIRTLEWVPRNFAYQDGLKIIHRELELAFGDENGHLSIAVLEELIELEGIPPFPEAIFQRWKFAHRHRHELLELPHTPHTRTILRPVVATKKVMEARSSLGATSDAFHRDIKSSAAHNSPALGPVADLARSKSYHSIEYTCYISKKGQRPRVLSAPTEDEVQRMLRDPLFGTGGRIESIKIIDPLQIDDKISNRDLARNALPNGNATHNQRAPSPIENLELMDNDSPYSCRFLMALLKAFRTLPRRGTPTPELEQTTKVERVLNFEEWSKEMFHAEKSDYFDLDSRLIDMHWPSEVHIPNANFARKFHLVPPGEALPATISNGMRLWTVTEEDTITLNKFWAAAREEIEDLSIEGEELDGRTRQRFFNLYMDHYEAPFTSSLFSDAGLDYNWAPSIESDAPESTDNVASETQSIEQNVPKEDLIMLPRATFVPPGRSLGSSVSSTDFDSLYDVTPPRSPRPTPQEMVPLGPITQHGNSTELSAPLRLPRPTQRRMSLTTRSALETRQRDSAHILSPLRSLQPTPRRMSATTGTAPVTQRDFADLSSSLRSPRTTPRKMSATTSTRPESSRQRDSADLSRVYQWRNRHHRCRGNFDGASDEIDEIFLPSLGKNNNTNRIHNTIIQDNGYELSICSNAPKEGPAMDLDRDFASYFEPTTTLPLRIYKQASQVRTAQGQQHLGDNNQDKPPHKGKTAFPPRTSSLHKSNALPVAEPLNHREVAHNRQPSDATSVVPSTLSSYRSECLFDASTGHPSPIDTARSTLSSYKGHHLSGSSGIIGNFVPITSPNMTISNPIPESNGGRGNPNALGKMKTTSNPYQFEPDTPLPARHESHQTTFTDFITDPHDSELTPSPQVFYLKKSPSAGNAISGTRKPTPIVPLASKPSKYRLQRSESSPNVSAPARFHVQYQRSPSPDLAARYGEIVDPAPPTRRGRSPPPQNRRGRSLENNSSPIAPNQHSQNYPRELCPEPLRARTFNQHTQGYIRESRPESPLRESSGDVADQNDPRSSTTTRLRPGSPTKTLGDVIERDEADVDLLKSPSRSPKKRSRSPMKKMFGEHGWLGRSPQEATETVLQNKKAFADRKEKVTMMGKLKTKLEEFAEKADLSPMSRSRFNEKPPKISVLSVSLGPPEQARILMEVELMLVHTANSFLMNQFSQGRMAVDSIKKTVDAWKSKGRPTVIEFMYDQTTQRDLVAINQHNFRFHGERAGDSIRINSMLYNWKLVANQMAIRTFCDADTVILKLLFDIEQILELLGARDPLLLRLQQIRATANERMRLARQRKDRDSAGQDAPMGRERTWHSHSSDSAECNSLRESMDDPYGGMKLVPDSYREFG